jgi:hypothetical protein
MNFTKVGIVLVAMLVLGFSCKKKETTSPINKNTGVKTISLRFRSDFVTPQTDGMRVTYQLSYSGNKLVSATPNGDASQLGTIYFTYSGDNVQSAYRTVHWGTPADTALLDSVSFTYRDSRIDSMFIYQRRNNIVFTDYAAGFTYSGGVVGSIVTNIFDPIQSLTAGSDIIQLKAGADYGYAYDITALPNNLNSLPIWVILNMGQLRYGDDYWWTYPLSMNSHLVNSMHNTSVLYSKDRMNFSYLIKESRITRRITEHTATGVIDTVEFGY